MNLTDFRYDRFVEAVSRSDPFSKWNILQSGLFSNWLFSNWLLLTWLILRTGQISKCQIRKCQISKWPIWWSDPSKWPALVKWSISRWHIFVVTRFRGDTNVEKLTVSLYILQVEVYTEQFFQSENSWEIFWALVWVANFFLCKGYFWKGECQIFWMEQNSCYDWVANGSSKFHFLKIDNLNIFKNLVS